MHFRGIKSLIKLASIKYYICQFFLVFQVVPEKKWKIINLPHTVKVDYLLNFTHYFYLFSTLMLLEVKLSEIYNCKVKKNYSAVFT